MVSPPTDKYFKKYFFVWTGFLMCVGSSSKGGMTWPDLGGVMYGILAPV